MKRWEWWYRFLRWLQGPFPTRERHGNKYYWVWRTEHGELVQITECKPDNAPKGR
jgi:hypothetical protein